MAMLHCTTRSQQAASDARAGRVLSRRRPRANRGAMAEARCVAGSASAGASILERARVLVSSPPLAAWGWRKEPAAGTPEAACLAVLREPRAWGEE